MVYAIGDDEVRKVSGKEIKMAVMKKLTERGVTIEAIADIVYQMQKPYAEHCRWKHV